MPPFESMFLERARGPAVPRGSFSWENDMVIPNLLASILKKMNKLIKLNCY